MRLVRWKRFTWDLSELPNFEHALPSHFAFRGATREDARTVRTVVITAFALDSAWSDALKIFQEGMESQIETAFQREEVPALVILHGSRIIAASILSPDLENESQLVSGPCVLWEYCNRGLGTALLYQSLKQLRQAGLERAMGITKENVPACKFVYPKFGSTSSSYNYEPHLVGS